MKEKKNETVPVALLVGLLLLCTVAAGGLALLAKGDKLKLPEIEFSHKETIIEPEAQPVDELPAETDETEVQMDYVDEELHKIANTYGESFGLLVGEGKSTLVEDKYCAEELYAVKYDSGEVQINRESKELYWFEKYDVPCQEIRLTENQLVKKAKEYFAILQLEKEYGNIARKVDRDANIITVIFQRVIDEELELYSNYEAVKMILSAQSGELMSCKIFDMPLVEQEGQMIGQTAALTALQDELMMTIDSEEDPQLMVCSPLLWGDEANYTSRIVWVVTAADSLYYIDAYSADVLGTRPLTA